MRVLVDSVTLTDTAVCFERGNQDAARFHEALAGRLAHFGAMAGDASLAEEYLFLGEGRHVTHEGERPIAITWELTHPMPTDFFNSATVAAS